MLLEAYPIELENCDPDEDFIVSETVVTITAPLPTTDRSIARRASLQILYELDTTEHDAASVLEVHFAERPEAYAVRQVIRRLVGGVIAHRAAIDAILQEYAPEFPIDQVAVVDRNILRMAVFEHLLQTRETPIPVIINEAVRLAQVFGADHSHSFVHGVLGAITAEAKHKFAIAVEEVDGA
ncbi:MAG: transcription antitermination factor NusB [Chloroflexi bacterium]|nr:transcription antitermination factor NusB [Chloroflexota bacterium]